MSFRKLDAGQGIAWLTEAVQLLQKNPTPFALMGLAIGVALMVPLLGAVALTIFGPALYGGVMFAAREQAAGRPAEFAHLFRAFQQPGKLPRMLLLCLPGLAAGLLIGVLALVFLGGALLAAGVSAAADANALAGASLGIGGVLFVVLALAIGLSAHALVMFATPRVMLRDLEPIEAMKQSAAAFVANIGAVLVFLVVIALAAVLVSMLVGVISHVLAELLLMTALVPLVSTATLIAAQQIFDDNASAAAPPPPPIVEV